MADPSAEKRPARPDGQDEPLGRVALLCRSRDCGVSIQRLFQALHHAMPPGVRTDLVFAPRQGARPGALVANARWVRRARGDLNHLVGDTYYLAAVLPRRRTMLTIHDLVILKQLTGWRRRVIRWLWFAMPVRRCRLVTCISEQVRDELLAELGCDPAKVRVISNCIFPGFSHQPSTFNTALPRILQLGTKWNKNVERLIDALQGLPCHLRVIGPVDAKLRARLEASGLAFSDAQGLDDAQILDEYRQSDIVSFASLHEGFGLPILEAQATGRVVVTSDREPMASVAGGAACLVDPEDTGSMREGFTRVIRDAGYRDRLIADGLRNVERFGAPEIARQYAQLYRELTQG